MAQITIEIPNPVAGRVVDALCALYGYSETLEDGTPNPVTRAQFADRKSVV